jgi:hypothetical protein
MQAQPLVEFIGKHQGETAWLFGKGPSFDGFDFSQAGALRCGINDVAAHVPGCIYGFAHDEVTGWADLYDGLPGFTLFQPFRTVINEESAPPCHRVVFDDAESFSWSQTREQAARDGLVIGSGTLSGALQILWIMGVSKIICVGIDGGQSHATSVQWRTALQNEHYKLYDRIRTEFISRASQLGVQVQFWGAASPSQQRGNMKIMMKRSVWAGNLPLKEGASYELTESTAKELINMGAALHVAEPVVETAATEPPQTPEPRKTRSKKAAK